MDPGRKRRIRLVVSLSLAVVLSTSLIYVSFTAASEEVTPSELLARYESGRTYKLGGVVQKGTVQEIAGGKTFRIEDPDRRRSVPVRYIGAFPDPFREGREVMVTVKRDGRGVFVGERNSLTTKCPSKFKPQQPA